MAKKCVKRSCPLTHDTTLSSDEFQRKGTKRPLEDRYIVNAAVLPDLLNPPAPDLLNPPAPDPLNSGQASPEAPLGIHNHTVEQFQEIFHSVVEPVRRPTGSGSLALGRRNKLRLWKAMGGPSLHSTNVGEGERVQVWETYNVKNIRSVKTIEVDISLEPGSPRQPKRKRART